jgi:hypothetical protein
VEACRISALNSKRQPFDPAVCLPRAGRSGKTMQKIPAIFLAYNIYIYNTKKANYTDKMAMMRKRKKLLLLAAVAV